MKTIVFSIFVVVTTLCPAQVVSYGYDAAGNRISRGYTSGLMNKPEEIVLLDSLLAQDTALITFFDEEKIAEGNATESSKETITAIETSKIGKTTAVFPNPTQGMLTLETSGYEATKEGVVILIDKTGKQYIKQTYNWQSTQLDLTGLAAGTYSLIIMDGKEKKAWEVVKN